MLTADIRDTISRSVLCWLATSSADNIPNVSPKEVFAPYGDSSLIIANIASPNSARNVQENPQVCVSFIDIFSQKGYQVKGSAEVVDPKNARYPDVVAPLKNMVGDRFPIRSVIFVNIKTIKKILAPSYLMYPDETDEQSQTENAMKTYRVKPAD